MHYISISGLSIVLTASTIQRENKPRTSCRVISQYTIVEIGLNALYVFGEPPIVMEQRAAVMSSGRLFQNFISVQQARTILDPGSRLTDAMEVDDRRRLRDDMLAN